MYIYIYNEYTHLFNDKSMRLSWCFHHFYIYYIFLIVSECAVTLLCNKNNILISIIKHNKFVLLLEKMTFVSL